MTRQLVHNRCHSMSILMSMPNIHFVLVAIHGHMAKLCAILAIDHIPFRLELALSYVATEYSCDLLLHQQLIWHQPIAPPMELQRTYHMSYNWQKISRQPIHVQRSLLMRATTNTGILSVLEPAVPWSQDTYWTYKSSRDIGKCTAQFRI